MREETGQPLLARLAWVFICGALMVYGSLYPLTGWHRPTEPVVRLLLVPLSGHLSRGDLLVNLLAYLPLGFAVGRLWPRRPVTGVVSAGAGGMLLSLGVELLQTMLPGRTPSVADLVTNTTGAFLGGLAVFLPRPEMGGHRLRSILQRGSTVVIASWALWQLAPFVPSVDVAKLREGLKPIWYAIKEPGRFSLTGMIVCGCYGASMGVALCADYRRRYRAFALFLAAGTLVLALKTLIVDRFVLPEEVLGFGAGALVAALLLQVRGRLPLAVSLLLACGVFIFTEIRADGSVDAILAPFNWCPLRYHLSQKLAGLPGIFEQVFPGVLIGWTATALSPERRALVPVVGGLCGVIGVFAMEWHQRSLPGRTPDITQVVLFLAGWTVVCGANSRFLTIQKDRS